MKHRMSVSEAMRLKDRMPRGMFWNVDGITADTIWLAAIEAAEQYHGIPRAPREPWADEPIPAHYQDPIP